MMRVSVILEACPAAWPPSVSGDNTPGESATEHIRNALQMLRGGEALADGGRAFPFAELEAIWSRLARAAAELEAGNLRP